MVRAFLYYYFVYNNFSGSNAVIHGDITCKSLNVHAKAVLMGQLQVSPKSIIKSRYKPSPPTPNKPSTVEATAEDDTEDAASLQHEPSADINDPQNSNNDEEPQVEAEPEEDPVTAEPAVVEEPKRTFKNILLIHEPQVDFYVGGSMNSTTNITAGERIAEFIENNLELIDDIYVTLDMHHVSANIVNTLLLNDVTRFIENASVPESLLG